MLQVPVAFKDFLKIYSPKLNCYFIFQKSQNTKNLPIQQFKIQKSKNVKIIHVHTYSSFFQNQSEHISNPKKILIQSCFALALLRGVQIFHYRFGKAEILTERQGTTLVCALHKMNKCSCPLFTYRTNCSANQSMGMQVLHIIDIFPSAD